MRRVLAVVFLALTLTTVSASAAPRGDDDTFFGRIQKVASQLVRHIRRVVAMGDEMLPPKP